MKNRTTSIIEDVVEVTIELKGIEVTAETLVKSEVIEGRTPVTETTKVNMIDETKRVIGGIRRSAPIEFIEIK